MLPYYKIFIGLGLNLWPPPESAMPPPPKK